MLAAWCVFCLFANRLHDIDRSALWIAALAALPMLLLLPLTGTSGDGPNWAFGISLFVAPAIALVAGIALLFFKGTPGPNSFGDQPSFMAS